MPPVCRAPEPGQDPVPACTDETQTPRCESSAQFDLLLDCEVLASRCLEAHRAEDADFGYYRCYGRSVVDPDVVLYPSP